MDEIQTPYKIPFFLPVKNKPFVFIRVPELGGTTLHVIMSLNIKMPNCSSL